MAHAPAPRLMAGQDSKCGLVQLLVSHATAGVSCSDATRQAYQGRLLSYALRLLASNLAVSAHPGDAASVVQAIKQRLYQQQRDGDAARCAATSGLLTGWCVVRHDMCRSSGALPLAGPWRGCMLHWHACPSAPVRM